MRSRQNKDEDMKAVSIAVICCSVVGTALAGQEIGRAHPAPAKAVAGSRPQSRPVSFRNELVPLFRNECTMCHHGEIPMGELDLTPAAAYQNLVRVQSVRSQMARITPGKPDSSYLLYKVSGKNAQVKGGGFGMPWGASLMPGQVDLIRRWIREGARDN
jgi:hypothetical protein